jgi:hypothetical protein
MAFCVWAVLGFVALHGVYVKILPLDRRQNKMNRNPVLAMVGIEQVCITFRFFFRIIKASCFFASLHQLEHHGTLIKVRNLRMRQVCEPQHLTHVHSVCDDTANTYFQTHGCGLCLMLGGPCCGWLRS